MNGCKRPCFFDDPPPFEQILDGVPILKENLTDCNRFVIIQAGRHTGGLELYSMEYGHLSEDREGDLAEQHRVCRLPHQQEAHLLGVTDIYGAALH